MAETKTTSRERTNFSKIRTAIQIPNLIEVQKNSYERFLQMNMLPEERDDTGLQAVFNSVSPISDFRGVSTKSFDGRGNYTLGLRDQLIFPEISYEKVDKIRGMNVTIVTTARSDDEARELLKQFGMPFRQ